MWARVQDCFHSDPEHPAFLDLRRSARERVPGHGMPADDGSAAKFAIHAKLFVSDVDCLSWFSAVPCAVREPRRIHAIY